MKAYINCISYYLPEEILTNDLLVKEFPEWSSEKVVEKIGVSQRHISAINETAGDMAFKAAQKLFHEYTINPEIIDFILLCTQSPDYFFPATACLLQTKLSIPTTSGSLDFNLGCSGYIYGLSLAKGLIYAGIAKNILLLTSDTLTKYIHPLDKANRSILGDGATASLISTTGFAEIGNFVLGTDGKGAENIIVRSGSSRQPEKLKTLDFDASGSLLSPDHFYMNGSEVFNFALDSVPPLVSNVLAKNDYQMADIDQFVFHQANKYMLTTIRKVCSIDKDKFYIDLDDTGNTVSSTIPIALKKLSEKNIPGNNNYKMLLAGFGVGYSWGACTLKYGE